MTDKEFDIKKAIEESPDFEDLPLEEQWGVISFMLSVVTDPEALEIIDFLLEQLNKAYSILKEIADLKAIPSFEEGFMEVLEKTKDIKIDPKDVYIIESEEGLIKIGLSRNPQKRLKSLQRQTRYKLKILLVIPNGGREKEKEIQERYKKYNVFGEWFEKSPEIMNFIQDIKDNTLNQNREV